MKGVAILLLCAASLAHADQRQLSRSGHPCQCHSQDAKDFCAHYASEGKVTSHENCNQFYKCSHGKAIPFFCPSPLVFNSKTKECDWHHNVKCGSRPIVEDNDADCDPEVPEVVQPDQGANCDPAEAPRICAAENSDGVLVAHKNCHQFYKCANGVPVSLNCYGNLLYNPYKGECDWPENVECGDRTPTDIDNGGDNEGGTGDSAVCNCNPADASDICAAPGSSGILIAHEKCNKYYKCVHGAPVAMKCHLGLMYNPHTEECDWPHNVNCADRPITETDKSEEVDEGTCNCNPSEAPGICAEPESSGILVAHENCNQFYKCDHGLPVAMKCNNELLYNPYTEQCDWPHNVNCGDRPIPEIDNGGEDNKESEEDNGTCNCNPGEAPGICDAPGSSGILIAHENCNKYYKCVHGVPVAMKCHFGLLYNPHTQICDWPHNVNCADRPIIEIDSSEEGTHEIDSSEEDNHEIDSSEEDNYEENESTCNCNPHEAPGICAAPGSNGILIAHEKCNKFYKCSYGVPVAMNCNPGLLYNPHTEQCDWPHNVNCAGRPIIEIDRSAEDNHEEKESTCNCNPHEAPGICAAPGSNGILIAHEKCNKFYKCSYGVPVAMNCNPGLLYNPHTEQCDWPHNVNCAGRPIIEIDSREKDDHAENYSTRNSNPHEAPGICAAPGSNGILIAHEKCNKFYKCSYGVPVAMNCNPGLLYNPHTEQCDWPHNVNCAGRTIIEIDSREKDDHAENESTRNSNPRKAPGICAAPGSNGILIAHEKCNQFYKCSYGVPVAMNCNPGLLYNPHTEQCDWPHNVNCDRPITETDNSNEESEEKHEATCNCDPSKAPAICAAPGSSGILIAHRRCDKYYMCAHGAPVVMNCNSGLLYNPYTEQCDWPHNVNCKGRSNV